jgi:hypothetical protein
MEAFYRGDQMAGRLRLLDLQDPASPRDAGTIDLDHPFDWADLENDGRFVYALASGCAAEGDCSHRILVVDPAAGAPAAALDLPGQAFDLFAADGLLYVAAGSAGLYAWDVTDPANPVLAAHVQPGAPGYGPVLKVVVEGEWVYLSDAEAGLYVYQKGE